MHIAEYYIKPAKCHYAENVTMCRQLLVFLCSNFTGKYKHCLSIRTNYTVFEGTSELLRTTFNLFIFYQGA